MVITSCVLLSQFQVDGDWRYDARRSMLLCTIELIDNTNRSGSMEFVVPGADTEVFFPIEISFGAVKTLCEVEIESVINPQTDAPVKYGFKRTMQTTQYAVV